MDNRRKKLIAKVKISQQQLGMDDDTYRDLLEGSVGKRSAAKLNEKELTTVIEVMKSKGFQDQSNGHEADKPDVTEAKQALVSKIEALLADGNKPWRYAEAMAERMFNRKRIQWLNTDQLHRLVAALQINANREKEKS